MSPSRLRAGELIAGVAAVALAVALGLAWFDAGVAGAHESGIRALGWLAALAVVLAVVAGLALAVATLTERNPRIPVAVGVLTVPAGLLAMLAVLVRLVAEPGLGAGLGDGEVAIRWPAWAGLVLAAGIVVGAWIAIGDERTGSRHAREQTERVLAVRGAPRPVPPSRD